MKAKVIELATRARRCGRRGPADRWAELAVETPAADPAEPAVPVGGDAPPHSAEAEAATLGAILLSEQDWAMHQVRELRSIDFFVPAHRVTFAAIRAMDDRCVPVDVVTVADWLADGGLLEVVGGADYLNRLLVSVPSVRCLRRYARIVREMALFRRLLAVTVEIRDGSLLAELTESRS